MNMKHLPEVWLDGVARELCARAGFAEPIGRDTVRVWDLSGVQRLRIADGTSAILKYAGEPFTDEAAAFRAAAAASVPVPVLYSHAIRDSVLVMLLEDLGQPQREATDADGAVAAARLHRSGCDQVGLVWDEVALASLPELIIESLQRRHADGQLIGTAGLLGTLAALAKRAQMRATDATTPPFGATHGELHPTSVHISTTGWRLVDFGMSFTGPAVLDLATWQGTRHRPDHARLRAQLRVYIAAGGDDRILTPRGGLPAAAWALGWHRLWSAAWLLRQALPAMDCHEDEAITAVLRRQIGTAAAIL
jgi:hypothetical protein